MRVCIVIPVFNEEAIIRHSITTIIDYAKRLSVRATIVAVDDGSRDATGTILRELARQYETDEFCLITHMQNKGYGAALKTGSRFAIDGHYDYALFMDSDLTNHPAYLAEFCNRMHEGWGYIKATRYARGGSVEAVPFMHRVISRVGNAVAAFLYGLPLTDLTNGFRAVRINILQQMDLREGGFPVIMEELCQAKLLTDSFCEIPYKLTARRAGEGVTHFSYGLRHCLQYLRYALRSFLAKPYRNEKEGRER